MNGILNINKPRGITSFQAVAAVRRAAGTRKAGHSGTLDPEAKGVLPICLGKATRLSEYLMDAPKTYSTVIRLGVSTDTYDLSGTVTATGDTTGIDRTTIEKALETFRGHISQVPPMYSALKRDGRPLYRLAREGISVSRPPRKVQIYRLELLDWNPPLLTVEMDCSRGTYVRSLAHDLGEKLGCGAAMAELVRIRCGGLNIKDAVSLEDVAAAARENRLEEMLLSPDAVIGHLPAIRLDEAQVEAFGYGQLIPTAEIKDMPWEVEADTAIRVYDENNEFLGIASPDTEDALMLKPRKVFRPSPPRPIG